MEKRERKMAKETIDTVGKLASFIDSQLISKRFVANYQPVMIKCLLKNGIQTRKQIARELHNANNAERELVFYDTVPVYRVLVSNGVVTKTGNNFELNLKVFSEEEKEMLLEKLDDAINRQMSFAKSGYLPFKDARDVMRIEAKKHNIKNLEDWKNYVKSGKKPDNIPANPSSYYKKKKNTSEKK